MNKSQKEVIKKVLKDEQKQLQWLKQVYEQAAKDCSKKIAELSSRKDMENLQSIIYQKQYQEALLGQINATLDELQSNTFISVDEYLNKCYETGYTGAMYDIAKQGIPIISPIDQKQVLRAIQTNSALSQGLYNRLGEDTKDLKKHIRVQISRGIANGSTWNEVADELTHKMKSPFKKAKNNAMRIVRTEGHRIQMTSQIDACQQAKKKGADVVKQWDSTLDGRTRSSHASVDGEIRELDEEFSNGLMMPGDPNGAAAEVCNCRCVLLQRARWALDKAELDTLKERAEYFGLDKTDNFEEFEKKYLNIVTNSDIIEEHNIMPLNLQLFGKSAKNYDTIILPKDEYGKVIHEINTNITEEQLNKKVVSKCIGDYIYTFEVKGYDNYRIIDKEPID